MKIKLYDESLCESTISREAELNDDNLFDSLIHKPVFVISEILNSLGIEIEDFIRNQCRIKINEFAENCGLTFNEKKYDDITIRGKLPTPLNGKYVMTFNDKEGNKITSLHISRIEFAMALVWRK